jgi:multidrug resistance efflux pump
VRILVDPDTGELLEVEDRFLSDWTPYDYRQAKAAVMRASHERREAEKRYREAVQKKGEAEASYRRLLALAVVEAKAEHGSTLAVSIAKGREDVAQAKEDALVAEGMVYAALERLRLCSEDRQSLSQLIAWSRSVDPSSFEGAS